jgi:hypothetical protein
MAMRSAAERKRIASASSSGALARCRKAAIRLRRSRNTLTSSSTGARDQRDRAPCAQASRQLRRRARASRQKKRLERAQQRVLVGEAA